MQKHKTRRDRKRRKLSDAEKFARRVARRCDLLASKLPEIDRHDLELIVAEQLKTPEERMRVMFLQQHDEGLISCNKALLAKLAETLAHAELEALMFDDFAALASGVTAPKKKINLFVWHDKDLQSKLKKFERTFGVARLRSPQFLPQVIREVGRTVSVDFVLAHSSRKSFNSFKTRAKRISFGAYELPVVAREDVAATAITTQPR